MKYALDEYFEELEIFYFGKIKTVFIFGLSALAQRVFEQAGEACKRLNSSFS